MEISSEKISFESNHKKVVGQLFLPGEAKPAPLLIICHAGCEFKEDYFELAEFLASHGFAAFAIDMHGNGESEGPRYYVNIPLWVQNIRDGITALEKDRRIDTTRVAAFGLSSGGSAILEAGVVEPRLKALVALDATVADTLPFYLSVIFRILIVIGTIKRKLTGKDLRIPMAAMAKTTKFVEDPVIQKKVVEHFAEINGYMPLPGAAQAFVLDTIRRVHLLKIPTLVIWGEKDELDPPTTAKMIYEKLTCPKRLEIIAGNGHAGHLDFHKAKVFALTLEWLKKYLSL